MTDEGRLLELLLQCRDTIARLVVAMPGRPDVEALQVMDRASRLLDAHGRGDS